MAFRYNNDSGDFEEVTSVTERIDKFCRRVLRVIFRTVCWLVAAALVGGGVVFAWKHRTAIGEKISAMNSHFSGICDRCSEVWNSCVAALDRCDLQPVRQVGDYRDWADFAKSAAWVIALPLGVLWMFESRSDFLFRCAGLALAVMGAASFWVMVSGAFKYNSGSSRWLSLFGRVAVILLLVFALGRLQGLTPHPWVRFFA